MKLTHRTPEEFDTTTASDEARDVLRSLRSHGVVKSVASTRSSQHSRWRARLPIPSRTLGGC
jgi:hypothetical protein